MIVVQYATESLTTLNRCLRKGNHVRRFDKLIIYTLVISLP